MSKYGVISGLYFPVFGLNTDIHGVNPPSPSTGKYGPEITPYLDTSRSVIFSIMIGLPDQEKVTDFLKEIRGVF